MRPTRAFTLIELLVVITIIVVLLALLVPALEKAIYQAELTLDGANLHGIVTGGVSYTVGHKRRYPDSERPRTVDRGFQPDTIGREDSMGTDFRIPIKDYIPLPLLQCPLTGKIDLSQEGNDSGTWVFATYDLWFSWAFERAGAPQRGMFKLGDRFEYGGTRFRLLASDKHILNQIEGFDQAGHPDHSGIMWNEVLQNYSDLPVFGAVEAKTSSRWGARQRRGLVDLNFGADDGSVFRFYDVITDDPSRSPEGDERLSAVPAHGSDRVHGVNWRIWIPAAE